MSAIAGLLALCGGGFVLLLLVALAGAAEHGLITPPSFASRSETPRVPARKERKP